MFFVIISHCIFCEGRLMLDLSNTFYEKIKGFTIFPRSFMPKEQKLILLGPPKSGKTSIALELARNFKHPVFIDCADTRLDIKQTSNALLKLFLERKFDLLIVDNFAPAFSLPNFAHIVLTANSITQIPESILSSFALKSILPLKFEEYVSFSKGSRPLESIFSHFLKEGNLPEISFLPEFKKLERNQEILKLHFLGDFELFLPLLSYQAKPFSTHNFYIYLKQKFKISKDRIYRFMQTLIESKITILLSHITTNQPKKLYFYNFAIPYILSSRPNFQAIFENLILCELLHRQTQIFYSDDCDFVSDECAYFAMPFPSSQLIESKLAQMAHQYKHTFFITTNATNTTYQNYSILSFIDFTLQ